MIFVTVGTHEQPFNRLIKEIDSLKGNGLIKDNVIIQRGYSTYQPQSCEYYDVIDYDEMIRFQNEARIIIAHGGPASFIYPLSIGKVPIIVPRQKKYHEHVNNHQLEFCEKIAERGLPIILIEDIQKLHDAILRYDQTCAVNHTFESHNKIFVEKFIAEMRCLFN